MTKTATVTVTPGTPAYPAAPAIAFHLYATPSPRSTAFRQKGSFPNRPEHFRQWSQLDASPPDGWYGPIRHMTFVRFPGVRIIGNGYPEPGHDGPITGVFDVPTTTGMHRESRTYYREGLRGLWIPRDGTYVDPPGCQTGGPCRVVMLSNFPGRDAVPGVPDIETVDTHDGWNAGANSVDRLDGDLRTVFQVDIAAAGAVGFAFERPDAGLYTSLSHAFYFDTDPLDGTRRVACMEFGRWMTTPTTYTRGDEFELRRQSGLVAFSINGESVYVSPNLSTGPVIVGAALFRAQDRVL
ncbi:hypothetical protein [Lysobacter sp. CA199]|uniref:hypothetical protein n=1 Tax=Lysobacter sp. CA199 TaxID=3455608 RepID=UPI003F8D26D9